MFEAQEILQELDGNECLKGHWLNYKEVIYKMRVDHQQQNRDIRQKINKYHEAFDIDDSYDEDLILNRGDPDKHVLRLGEDELLRQELLKVKVLMHTMGIRNYANSEECSKGELKK